MGQISQFLRQGDGLLSHYCPACREMHSFSVTKPDHITGNQWSWDGNIVTPTFSPSMLLRGMRGKQIISVCHYTLIAGKLSFQKDCTHALCGISMQLPALPLYMRDADYAI